jgi:predicted kinase
MNAIELADAMEIRASIRRKATSRKSVTEGANDRLADQLDQAATMLRKQQTEIEALKEVNAKQVDYISEQKSAYEKLWKEHMELFWKHEEDKELTNE